MFLVDKKRKKIADCFAMKLYMAITEPSKDPQLVISFADQSFLKRSDCLVGSVL